MIARELLVKLGFVIDEKKLINFNGNINALKANMNSIKSKFALNIDQSGLNGFNQKIEQVKSKIDTLKSGAFLNLDQAQLQNFTKNVQKIKSKLGGMGEKINLNFDQTQLQNVAKTAERVKSKIDEVKSGFTINVDDKELNLVATKLKQVNDEMLLLQRKMVQFKNPVAAPKAYQKELETLKASGSSDYELITKLNEEENIALEKQFKHSKQKYAQLKLEQKQLLATKQTLQEASRESKRFGNEAANSFKKAATAASQANLTFSRYFTRFALIGSGSFLLALRNTLKDAKDFQSHRGKHSSNIFSPQQLQSVGQFNIAVRQTKRLIGDLRNGFIIGLLPAFKEHLTTLNHWLIANKQLIQMKLHGFVETLASVFKNLTWAISGVFSVFNPLVNLIGGWGSVLTGFIGVGILSWLVRLGAFLRTGAAAIIFFSGAVRTLTVALMTNPLCIALAAIAAAVVLIADEFIVTARGGDSLINRFTGLKTVVNNFVDVIKVAWEWLVKLNQAVYDFTFGGGAGNMFNGMVEDAKETATKISDIFGNMIPTFGKNSANGMPTLGQNGKYQLTPDIVNRNLNLYHQPLGKPGPANVYNTTKKTIQSPVTNVHFNISTPTGGLSSDNQNMIKLMTKQIESALDLRDAKLLAAIGG